MVNIQTILELLILKNKTFCCLLQQKEKGDHRHRTHAYISRKENVFCVFLQTKRKERRRDIGSVQGNNTPECHQSTRSGCFCPVISHTPTASVSMILFTSLWKITRPSGLVIRSASWSSVEMYFTLRAPFLTCSRT